MAEYRKQYPNAPVTSDETKHKMVTAHKGEKKSPESIAKGVATRKGYLHSEETKRKIGKASEGRKHSPKAKRKMVIAQTGKKQSLKTIAKRVATREEYLHSEETKKKIGRANTGKKRTREARKNYSRGQKQYYEEHPEALERLSQQATGKIPSLETCHKLSISLRRYHREHPEVAKRISKQTRGKNSPSWRGGSSLKGYPKEFNNSLREKVRDRDGYACVICKVSEQNISELLSVHHIDYNKKNNDENNLLSLCRSCHIATSGNREYWPQELNMLQEQRGFTTKAA